MPLGGIKSGTQISHQQLPKNYAQTINVRTSGRRLAFQNLRGKIKKRSRKAVALKFAYGTCKTRARLSHFLHQELPHAEICDVYPQLAAIYLPDKDIGGLNVAMENPGFVSGLEALCDLSDYFHDHAFKLGLRPLRMFSPPGWKILSVQMFHQQIVPRV